MGCGAAVLFPAVLLCRHVFFRGRPAAGSAMAAAALLNPAAVLIDHGHFQYNGISLGLSVRLSTPDRNGGLRYQGILASGELLYL